ncbi:hypothetical protein MNBD_NITROSPINAE01-1022 [hydrothermal vent metagenome]|uniref:Uncharacterized protein n=1 Tax=hydrothermal vent metagenome TaxID=652676 RepID=A0A3B1C3A5_9ZZZZ
MKIFSLVVISLAMVTGQAEKEYVSPYQAMESAATVLKNEIRRDEKILSAKMNIQRVKATRAKLESGLGAKEEALSKLKQAGIANSAIASVLKKTLKTEKRISEDTRIGNAVRIRAQRALKANLPGKKKALAQANKWLRK